MQGVILAENIVHEESEEEKEEEDVVEDGNKTAETQEMFSSATRLNAIVNAANFLSTNMPSIKEPLVNIVKGEFEKFTGYVSKHFTLITTSYHYDISLKLLVILSPLLCLYRTSPTTPSPRTCSTPTTAST